MGLGKCAIVTSYTPSIADIKGEDHGRGADREHRRSMRPTGKMLGDYFHQSPTTAANRIEEFENAMSNASLSTNRGR